MNPMQGAIKGKRMMGKEMPPEEAAPSQGEDQQLDLESLVAALTPEQKMELMGLLEQGGEQDPMAVEKGEPTAEERQKIEAQMADDDGGGADEPSQDSDEIAMGMLDPRQQQGGGMDAKPRNLGERMRMGLANKLKAKGKI